MPNKPRPVARMRALSSHSASQLSRTRPSELRTGQASKEEHGNTTNLATRLLGKGLNR